MNPEKPSGIIVVDKPSGWTSHDVVNKVRAIFGGIKVGHTGTLDPMATGVLVLMIGSATKTAPGFSGDTKRYLAEVTFGTSTDTYDATGTTISSGDPSAVDRDCLARSIAGLKGTQEQLPPLYSAVKVRGKKLYQYARSGKPVERTVRTFHVYRIEASLDRFPVVSLDIECSSGTYIRELANRLGEMNGCPAHLSSLRRVKSGRFGIEESVTVEAIVQAGMRGDPGACVIPVSLSDATV
jgi:tRNA pseudouridine55 synthase